MSNIIKTKRIDNPDGSYKIKEVYKEPEYDCCLSSINTFNADGKCTFSVYYKDKNFRKIVFSNSIDYYIDNGGYYYTSIFSQMQEDSYIAVKWLCDKSDKEKEAWFYADKECRNLIMYGTIDYLDNNFTLRHFIDYEYDISYDVYLDDQFREIKSFLYQDKEFKNLIEKNEFVYNDDGSYFWKGITMSTDFNDENYPLSGISYMDKDGYCYKLENFYDRECTQLYSLSTFEYHKNGSLTRKTSFTKCDNNGWKSTLEKFKANNEFYYGEYYRDDNFKTLGQTTSRKYYKNGNYRDIKKRIADGEEFRMNELYDSNNRLLAATYKDFYKENNKTTLWKNKCKYNNDGSYECRTSYIKQAKGSDYLSCIEIFDSNGQHTSTRYYRDRNFRKLNYIWELEILSEDKHAVCKTTYYNLYNQPCILYTTETVSDADTEKTKEKQYFYDKNGDLVLRNTTYKFTNDKGNKEEHLYKNYQDDWLPGVREIDKDGNVIKCSAYLDNNMQQLCYEKTFEYQDKKTYTCKTILHSNSEKVNYNTIEFYNNKKLTKVLYYKDQDFKELYAADTFEYLPNNRSIRCTVFEEPYHKMFSMIKYYKKDKRWTYALGYLDKNFNVLFCKTRVKYTKNHQIILRIYSKKQDGYNTEIEKYDNDKNLVYKKSYNLNYLIARFLFLFLR